VTNLLLIFPFDVFSNCDSIQAMQLWEYRGPHALVNSDFAVARCSLQVIISLVPSCHLDLLTSPFLRFPSSTTLFSDNSIWVSSCQITSAVHSISGIATLVFFFRITKHNDDDNNDKVLVFIFHKFDIM
jgi:hypothetical protein